MDLDHSQTGSLPASIYEIANYGVERRKATLSGLPTEDLVLTRAGVHKRMDILVLLATGLAALKVTPRSLPVWSAFNSRLIKETSSVSNTVISPLPHLDAPAPEYSSLLTMMIEMEKIQEYLNGPGAPVLVAADKALFSKLLEMKLTLNKAN